MSGEGDDGITSWIVKAVKRHKYPCGGIFVVAVVLCVASIQSRMENVMGCKEVLVKSDVSTGKRTEVAVGQRSKDWQVVIDAKAVQVSNNADVEAANRSTKSRFTEGPEIDIEHPSGPQNSKEEKKRKERERRKWLLAALAGGAAGLKVIAMMPNPDPNENNRLPDKIPNITTPQEHWFKWLWETRETRFEYRPLEFVRAYGEKCPEDTKSWLTTLYYIQANFSKSPYNYVHNYTYNNKLKNEDIRLAS